MSVTALHVSITALATQLNNSSNTLEEELFVRARGLLDHTVEEVHDLELRQSIGRSLMSVLNRSLLRLASSTILWPPSPSSSVLNTVSAESSIASSSSTMMTVDDEVLISDNVMEMMSDMTSTCENPVRTSRTPGQRTGKLKLGLDKLGLEELAHVTALIEMVHRCSDEALSWSFSQDGARLLPLLSDTIKTALKALGEDKIVVEDHASAVDALRNTVTLLRYFTGSNQVPDQVSSILSQPGLIYDIQNILVFYRDSNKSKRMPSSLATAVMLLFSDMSTADDYDAFRVNLGSNHLFINLIVDILVFASNMNGKEFDELNESGSALLLSLLEAPENRPRIGTNDRVISYITDTMSRCHTKPDWSGSNAVRAAHFMSIPPENAGLLTRHESGRFLDMLVSLVYAGKEVYSASSALSCLAANSLIAREEMNSSNLLDTLAKVSKLNPNNRGAAKCVAQIMPMCDHEVFRNLFILFTLDDLKLTGPDSDLLASTLKRVKSSPSNNLRIAKEDCILMSLAKLLLDQEISNRIKAQAAKVLDTMAKDILSLEVLATNKEVIVALATAANESKNCIDNCSDECAEEVMLASESALTKFIKQDEKSDKYVLDAFCEAEFRRDTVPMRKKLGNVVNLWSRLKSEKNKKPSLWEKLAVTSYAEHRLESIENNKQFNTAAETFMDEI